MQTRELTISDRKLEFLLTVCPRSQGPFYVVFCMFIKIEARLLGNTVHPSQNFASYRE